MAIVEIGTYAVLGIPYTHGTDMTISHDQYVYYWIKIVTFLFVSILMDHTTRSGKWVHPVNYVGW